MQYGDHLKQSQLFGQATYIVCIRFTVTMGLVTAGNTTHDLIALSDAITMHTICIRKYDVRDHACMHSQFFSVFTESSRITLLTIYLS